MMKRKGMGKGQGKGYKNMVGKDPIVHSQSAKGMKQPQKILRTQIKKKIGEMDIPAIEKMSIKLRSGYKPPKGSRLSLLHYLILEDANFHSLNNELTKQGYFGDFIVYKYPLGDVYAPKGFSEETERIFNNYRKKGGKTWEL